MTRYPNLYVELQYREFMFGHVVEAANITGRLLHAVLNGEEALTDYELFCAAKRLNRDVDYIKSSEIALFDASKNPDALSQFHEEIKAIIDLREKIEKKKIPIDYWPDHHYQSAMEFYCFINHHRLSTYAHYLYGRDSVRIAKGMLNEIYFQAARTKPRDVMSA